LRHLYNKQLSISRDEEAACEPAEYFPAGHNAIFIRQQVLSKESDPNDYTDNYLLSRQDLPEHSQVMWGHMTAQPICWTSSFQRKLESRIVAYIAGITGFHLSME
jgi:hypothetical protein